MPRTNYRPVVGETVFVSLSGHLPILITITGFRYHTYLKEDVMEYTRLDGTSSWASYKSQAFFPEIPVDTPYYYVLTLGDDDDCQAHSEEAFFFTPEDAFTHRRAIESGKIKPKHGAPTECLDFVIEVREVS